MHHTCRARQPPKPALQPRTGTDQVSSRSPTPGEHAGDRQQPDQGLVGRGPQRRRDVAGGGQQRLDLLRRADVGRGASTVAWQQVSRRDLGGRVERGKPGREAADDRQPFGPPVPFVAGGQRRPRDRMFHGHRRRAGLVEIVDELREQPAGTLELVAHRPAGREVVAHGCSHRVHAAPLPGHGRASSRRESRSTLA